VVQIVGSGEEPASGQIPFTPRAMSVLECALREALIRGEFNVGSEHILLGLARVNEGVAMQILRDFGVDSEKLRDGVNKTARVPARCQRPSSRCPRIHPKLPPTAYSNAIVRSLPLTTSELVYTVTFVS
jgi:ATP-dependent Clp protease ATP-binding subunit ClpA